MIELIQPYKGTNTKDGFEVMVIGLAKIRIEAPSIGGQEYLFAICIQEDGQMKEFPISSIKVDWRYNRATAVWASINDPEPEPEESP